MAKWQIPRFEPEVIKAGLAKVGRKNAKAIPTTSIRQLTVHGVIIKNNRGKADELEMCANLIETLPSNLR